MAEIHGLQEDHEQGESDVVAATLAYLARALVDNPDDVRVVVVPESGRDLIRLDVHPDDAGRVIGRGGRVARAIRGITKVAAALGDRSVFIQIGEPRAAQSRSITQDDSAPADGV